MVSYKIYMYLKKTLNVFNLVLIGLLLLSIYMNMQCIFNHKKLTIKYTIPKIENTFKKDTLISIPTKPYKETIFIHQKDKKVPLNVDYKINKDNLVNLNNELQNIDLEKDSLFLYKKILESYKINNYVEKFEDEYITITNLIEATGTINNLETKYTIKEKTIAIESNKHIKKNNNLYLGVGISVNNINNRYFNNGLNSLGLIGDVSYQSNNKNIYSLGMNTNKDIIISFKKPLFNK